MNPIAIRWSSNNFFHIPNYPLTWTDPIVQIVVFDRIPSVRRKDKGPRTLNSCKFINYWRWNLKYVGEKLKNPWSEFSHLRVDMFQNLVNFSWNSLPWTSNFSFQEPMTCGHYVSWNETFGVHSVFRSVLKFEKFKSTNERFVKEQKISLI